MFLGKNNSLTDIFLNNTLMYKNKCGYGGGIYLSQI